MYKYSLITDVKKSESVSEDEASSEMEEETPEVRIIF